MAHSNDSRRPPSAVTPLALAVLAALWLMPGGLALGTTITVTTVADENGSGPSCSLREAIASANGDADVGGCAGVGAYGADTIVFASTLSLPATIMLTDPAGALTVSSDVTITGPGATQLAIDGNHTTRVFSITTGQVMMSDLTIRHGNSNVGGGILNELGGTLTLTNSTLSGNSADAGGGIYNVWGTITLRNCTLSGNSAGQDCGGIYNYRGVLTVINSTLSGNSAGTIEFYGGGGGIYNYSGVLTLTNCTLSGNSAGRDGRGGGIANLPHCVEMAGCSCEGSSATVTNCTLSGNGANEFAGGGIDSSCPTLVTNSIIANSSGGNCGGSITDGRHNLQYPGTSCGETIPSLDPLLDPAGLKDNGGPTQTIALLPGSPAINAGDPSVCANPPVNGVDQRGYSRPGSGHTQCSIGAYEADGLSPEPCVGDCDGTGSVSIDELITLVNIALGNAQVLARPHGVPSGAAVNVALIIQAVNVALNGCSVSPAEQRCLTSGGTVATAMCCASSSDFPDTCATGACGCAPAASHEVRTCSCVAGCFDGNGCVRQ